MLTVDTNVITKNDRVSLVKESGGSSWSLVIRNVSTSDAGEYLCQVSTVPPERLYLQISVVGKGGGCDEGTRGQGEVMEVE